VEARRYQLRQSHGPVHGDWLVTSSFIPYYRRCMCIPYRPNALHRHDILNTGLLFLGGGNYSLRRDPLSAACLLLAICPRYPSRTIDHQFHLQPLRHLYALAVEPRVLRTVDVDSGQPVSVDIEAQLMDGQRLTVEAPALLPELTSVKAVSVLGVCLKGGSSALDSCRMDSSSPSSSPRPQYYPNSAVIHATASNHSDANNSSSTVTTNAPHLPHAGVVPKQTTRPIIPTLFVKAMQRRSYVPAAAVSSSTNSRSFVLPRDVDTNTQLQKALEYLHTELRRGGGLHDASTPLLPMGPSVTPHTGPTAMTTSRTTRTAQDVLSMALRRCRDLALPAALPCLLHSGAREATSSSSSSSRSEFLASILTHTLQR
jgi:hypothetical protein